MMCNFEAKNGCDANLDIDFLPEDGSKISEKHALTEEMEMLARFKTLVVRF